MWTVIAAKGFAASISAAIAPAFGNTAVDGLAISAMLSSACFMLITAHRRARLQRRPAFEPVPIRLTAPPGWTSIGFSDDSVDTAEILRIGQAHIEPASPIGKAKQGRGYHSKHRITDPDAVPPRWPDAKRAAPRHAAQRASFSMRLTSVVSLRPLAAQS
jgi:hypothetical protein